MKDGLRILHKYWTATFSLIATLPSACWPPAGEVVILNRARVAGRYPSKLISDTMAATSNSIHRGNENELHLPG
jgi:hypothetical protein